MNSLDMAVETQTSPVYGVISLICAVLMIIAWWKVFTKAGDKGWKSIIPIYNGYTQFKLFWNTKMFWITLALAVVAGICAAVGGTVLIIIYTLLMIAAFVIAIMFSHRLSKSFGHGTGFTVGLVLLQPIFVLILAFGKSEYKKIEG